jgi:hypothetical protein
MYMYSDTFIYSSEVVYMLVAYFYGLRHTRKLLEISVCEGR